MSVISTTKSSYRLISDGTWQGTKVIDLETGQEVQNIKSIVWSASPGSLPKIMIEIDMPEANISVEIKQPAQ